MTMEADVYKPGDAKAWQQTTSSLGTGMEQILSQPSEETTSVNASISDFQPPEL